MSTIRELIFGIVAVWMTSIAFIDCREFCLTESFHARCRRWNDVILVEHALFGRMELGRCVTRNFGHIGCSADVINQLDSACSGRPTCDLSVSDPSLVRTKPCPKDFTSYLEVSYKCVPAISPSPDECYESGSHVITTEFGYVTSFSPRHQSYVPSAASTAHGYTPPSASSVGTTSSDTMALLYDEFTPCPMEFRMLPGQRVNFTLYDFGSRNYSASNVLHGAPAGNTGPDYYDEGIAKICQRYATIDEPSSGISATICGGWNGNSLIARRERHVYTSTSNVVRLQLAHSPNLARFMIQFEVIGCPDPTWLPPDVHVRQVQVDRLVVFCNHSVDSFVLICRDNHWIGEIKNCSLSPSQAATLSRPVTAPPLNSSPDRSYSDILGLPHIGMSVAIILGVAMVTVVYVAVVMVCVVHIRRWRKKTPTSNTRRSLKFDPMPSSPPPSCSLSPCITYNERTPIAHGCGNNTLVPGHQPLYSEFFELRPRQSSRCLIEPAYQLTGRPIASRHVTDSQPMRYVRSVENDSKHLIDECAAVCEDDDVMSSSAPAAVCEDDDVMSSSAPAAVCRCVVDSTAANRPRSGGGYDDMTSLFGDGEALMSSPSPAISFPVRQSSQPIHYSPISPDVVPDSDMSTVI